MQAEIEVKAKIDNFDGVLAKLSALGCTVSEPITQYDRIYNVDGNFDNHKTPVLRIRTQGNRTIFTLKQNRENELDCIEKETDVSNADALNDILKLLGYQQTVTVQKTRRTCNYNKYEICLDTVEELGSFIEVEKLTDEDGTKVQQELLEFLQTLGVPKENRVFFGYDTLLMQKRKQ